MAILVRRLIIFLSGVLSHFMPDWKMRKTTLDKITLSRA